jgi:DnaJ-class molecular chaperone
MMAEDYYATLGVARGATLDEIHTAYRNLARRYHPDLNPDNEEAKKKFQAVQQAYEVLKDPKKRELFDRFGPSFESMGAGGGGPWRGRPSAGPGGGFTEVDLNELFGDEGADLGGGFADLFRQFTRRAPRKAGPGAPRGANIEHELQIPFRTAISGGTAQLSVRRHSGKVETIDVKIPPGIEDGKKIRLRGQGETGGQAGAPGDILITVRVAPHPHFQRQGRDLIAKVPLTLKEAVFGCRVDVPTPKGVVTLTIPPNTSGGKRLRIKGHGVQTAKGVGDLFAEVQIVLPASIDSETKEAIGKLRLADPANPRGSLVW